MIPLRKCAAALLAAPLWAACQGPAPALPQPAPPQPTQHHGLVGVFNTSKAVVGADGTLTAQGPHPEPATLAARTFQLLPADVTAAWTLQPVVAGEAMAALQTTVEGVEFRAQFAGVLLRPAAASVVVAVHNPQAAPVATHLTLGWATAASPLQWDGRALRDPRGIRLTLRAPPPEPCTLATAAWLRCPLTLAAGETRRLELFVLPQPSPSLPAELPDAVAVLAQTRTAWDGILGGAATFSAPDPWLGAALRASLVYLLLLRDVVGDFYLFKPGANDYNSFWYRDSAYMVRVMDAVGLHAYAEEGLRHYLRSPLPPAVQAMQTWGCQVAQHSDGRWECPDTEHDGPGQSLWALVGHWQMTRDEAWLRQAWPALRAGAMWIVQARQQTIGGVHAGTPHEGLLPIGLGETLISGVHVLYHDYWAVLGLHGAAAAAAALGEVADGALFAKTELELRASVERAVQSAFVDGYIQAAPETRGTLDWGSIAALYPCEVLPPADPRVTATLEQMWQNRIWDQYAYPNRTKIWTYITADWAGALLLRDEWQRAATLFAGYRQQASAVLGWWEEVFVDSLVGTGDDPHGWAAAQYVLWLQAMLARADDGGHLFLLGGVPPEWWQEAAPLHAAGWVLPAGRLEHLDARLTGPNRATVEWAFAPRTAGVPEVTLYLRGREVLAAACGTPAVIDGDAVTLQAAAGTCLLEWR